MSATQLPIEASLRDGVRWSHGAVELGAAARHRQAQLPPPLRQVLPPRERQNRHTLTEPGQDARPMQNERALAELYSHNNLWFHDDPAEALRALAAPELLSDVVDMHRASGGSGGDATAITHANGDLVVDAMDIDEVTPLDLYPNDDDGGGDDESVHGTGDRGRNAGRAAAGRRGPNRLIAPAVGVLGSGPAAVAAALVERGLATPDEMRRLGLNAIERVATLSRLDQTRRALRFFADELADEENERDAVLPERAPPGTYPLMRAMEERYGAQYARRADIAENGGGAMPLRSMETITRAYLFRFRLPPNAALDALRPCCNDERCLFFQFACAHNRPTSAYVGVEFLLPTELAAWNERRARGLTVNEENDGARRPCIDCLLYEWTDCVHDTLQLRSTPQEPLNTFVVPAGNYARDYLIPNEITGQRTGIVGYVPAYSTHTRQLEPLEGNPAAGADAASLARLFPQGFLFVNEVGQHFHVSLGQANACLGAPKSRPLAGSSGRRFATDAPRSVFLPRRSLELLAGNASAWLRFVRDCHTGVLADRYWLADLEQEERGGADSRRFRETDDRLPVAWLRRALVLPLPSPSTTTTRRPATVSCPADTAALLVRLLGIPSSSSSSSDEALATALSELADAVFCSFERGVSRWLRLIRTGDPVAVLPLVALYGRSPAVRTRLVRDEALGLPAPRLVHAALQQHPPDLAAIAEAVRAAALEQEDTSFVLWSVAMFRCGGALLFEHALHWPGGGDANAAVAAYKLRLFRDTHLDLLTHCVEGGRYDDAHLLAAAPIDEARERQKRPRTPRPALPWLALLYPQANRVCCAEELPDLVPALPLSNPHYDTGNKKAQETVVQAIVHPYICKVMNQACQRRQFGEILKRNEARFPVVGRLTRLIVRCVALGNLPHGVIHPLPLAARVRVNAALGPAAGGEERFRTWAYEHRLTVLFALREFYFYTAESNGLMDALLGHSTKWPRFKVIVRVANGDWRQEVARQTAADGGSGFWRAVDWDVWERRVARARGAPLVLGRMIHYHDQSLSTFVKLRKGRFEEVLLKKMTAVEQSLALDTPAALAWLRADRRMDYLHLVAWVAARRSHAPFAARRDRLLFRSRPLLALGLTRAGLAMLRDWLLAYHEYEMHDNAFKEKIVALARNDWRDYVLLKTFLRLFAHYRASCHGGGLSFLPIEHARAQVCALRASLAIEPWTATPPLLGVVYYCEGCMTLANTAVKPTVTMHGTADAAEVPHLPMAAVRFTGDLLEQLAFQSNASDGQCAGLRAAFYHPIDGHLYCRRSQRTRRDGLAQDAGAGNTGAIGEEDEEAVGGNLDDLDDEEGEEDDDDGDDNDADDADAASGDTVGELVERDVREVAALVDGMTLAEQSPFEWARRHAGNLVPTAAAAPAAAAANTTVRQDISRLALRDFRCGRLLKVDLVGAVMPLQQKLYALCVYCGRTCEMLNVNMTSRGLSCGLHSLPAEYPAYHRIWASHGQPRELLQQAGRAMLAPERLAQIRPPCIACSSPASRHAYGYDMRLRRFRAPVCLYHGQKLGVVRTNRELLLAADLVAPTAMPVIQPAPMRIDLLASELGLPLDALALLKCV